MMMMGIGMPISQASPPFMGCLRLVGRGDNAKGVAVVPVAAGIVRWMPVHCGVQCRIVHHFDYCKPSKSWVRTHPTARYS